MFVSSFAVVTEDLVICCYQVTKICSTKYDSAKTSSARGPCDFGPLADLAISVFREVSFNTALPRYRFSESDSREVLAGVSLDADTGKSRNRFPFAGTLFLFLFWFLFFVGSRDSFWVRERLCRHFASTM